MSGKLEDTVAQLLDWACGAPGQPPRPSSVRVVEVTQANQALLLLQFRVSDLRPVEELEARFEQMTGAGYAWVNVTYCGEIQGHGLVLLECPASVARKRGVPSINFSGPPKVVADALWNAEVYVRLTS